MDMTTKKWTIASIAVAAAPGLVGLGFAAMSTNPPFTVPGHIPVVFFVAAGIVVIAAVIYLVAVKKSKLNKAII